MKTVTAQLYEVKLYLGCIEDIDGLWINKTKLISEIGEFQESYKGTTVPVRVTDTTFVSETHYSEDGWEVSAISYPRTNHSHKQTLDFMLDLAEHLMLTLCQRRICVLDRHPNMFGKVYMLENY